MLPPETVGIREGDNVGASVVEKGLVERNSEGNIVGEIDGLSVG